MNGIEFTDNSGEVLKRLDDNIYTALNAAGITMEGFAKARLTQFPRVDTGRLRGSISHTVNQHDKEVVVGTNVDYAPYVEFGTGPYAAGTTEDGGSIHGRSDVPWFYVGDDGKGHLSYGMKPAHYLHDSLAFHKAEICKVIENYLKNF